jgi:beta-glucosidase-like glycosyl hydrolase
MGGQVMVNVSTVWGRELRALYNVGVAKGLDCWGPVVNLNRDPRWGRNGEGGAEDPYLMGEYAAAYTKGFQYQGAERNATKYLTALLTLVRKPFGLCFTVPFSKHF